MIRSQEGAFRGGHTLIELVAASGAAAMLAVGLSSSIGIALKASSTSRAPASARIEAAAQLTDMAMDLQFALSFSEKSAHAVAVAVPSRDGDSDPETVRYSWSGSAGGPLIRQYNGGAPVTVAPVAYDFGIEYHPSAATPRFLIVRLQPGPDGAAVAEAAIPLLNAP